MRLPEATSIRSVVIRCPNWIGDAVMATPIFRQVRRLFPAAAVTAIAHDPIAELLEGVAGIDEFLVFSRAKGRKRQEEARIAGEVRRRRVDLGILLTTSLSSAWMLWKARVRWRVGLCAHMRRFLLNIPVHGPSDECHDVERYSTILQPFGRADDDLSLSLTVTYEEQQKMARLLRSRGRRDDEQLVIINPGAAYGSAKCWPPDYFRAVAQSLGRTAGVFSVFIGDAKSAPMIDSIVNGVSPSVISCAGATSIRDLVALTSLGDCVLTNDSGPMHIAAAFNRPLVALFGSTSPKRTGPWKTGRVLYKHVACSPCYLRECPIDFRCMRRITPDDVVSEIQQLLSGGVR